MSCTLILIFHHTQHKTRKQAFFNNLGTGGLQIRIHLSGSPETHPSDIFYLRHRPSWKVRKNVFNAIKSYGMQPQPQPPLGPSQQQQHQYGASAHQQQQYGNQQYQIGQQQQQQQQNNNQNNNRIMAYSCNHDTVGSVTLTMGHGKKLDHMGIQVKLFGRIDMVRCFFVVGCPYSSGWIMGDCCCYVGFVAIFCKCDISHILDGGAHHIISSHQSHLSKYEIIGGRSTRGTTQL